MYDSDNDRSNKRIGRAHYVYYTDIGSLWVRNWIGIRVCIWIRIRIALSLQLQCDGWRSGSTVCDASHTGVWLRLRERTSSGTLRIRAVKEVARPRRLEGWIRNHIPADWYGCARVCTRDRSIHLSLSMSTCTSEALRYHMASGNPFSGIELNVSLKCCRISTLRNAMEVSFLVFALY